MKVICDYFKSIRDTFAKFTDYGSCASRKEFWYYALFVLFCIVLDSVCIFLFGQHLNNDGRTVFYLHLPGILDVIFILIIFMLILAFIAVSVRRLHDSGHNGYWFFVSFVPVLGIIAFFVFMLLPTNPKSEYSDTYFEDI